METYMYIYICICSWGGSSLAQVMACGWLRVEPWSEPVMRYCRLNPKDQTGNLTQITIKFSLEKCTWNIVCKMMARHVKEISSPIIMFQWGNHFNVLPLQDTGGNISYFGHKLAAFVYMIFLRIRWNVQRCCLMIQDHFLVWLNNA